MGWRDVEISSMKGNYFCIVCDKKEIQGDKNVIIIPRESYKIEKHVKRRLKKTNHGCGKLLLCICVSKVDNNAIEWGQNEWNIIKSSKKNVITKSFKHNDSCGHYYAYGNKGNFGMKGHSSVGQYSFKSRKGNKKQSMQSLKNKMMQYLASAEQSKGIINISKFLPSIHNHIAPIINKAAAIQRKKGNINLLHVPGCEEGCWKTSVCVNAETKLFHTEDDCGYTVITVPKQATNGVGNYHFLFMLQPKCYIGIKMNINVSFVFSGHLLTHRQHCSMNDGYNSSNLNFINCSSYANKRLFNHIKKSLLRH